MASSDVGRPGAEGSRPPKPRFLGLLNEIAEAERRGAEHFAAWAQRTDDREVRRLLLTVAAREAEHTSTFARRVVELGFEVRVRADNDAERYRAEVCRSGRSDAEKLALLGYDRPSDPELPDIFDHYFEDRTLDPQTGGLLGRFIAEERDSERLLHQAWLLATSPVVIEEDSRVV